MEVKFTAKRITRNIGFNDYCLEVITDKTNAKSIEAVLSQESKEWTITISKPKKHRTTRANAFLWALCADIGGAINNSKEQVYRDLVKRKGVFDYVVLRPDAVGRFIAVWGERGIGYFTEQVECGIDNAVQLLAYYGTSSYNTAEMARVIDEAVAEAMELGIPIKENELAEIREGWQ